MPGHGSNQTPMLQFKNHYVFNLCVTTCALEEILVSVIFYSIILLSLQYNVFATVDRDSISDTHGIYTHDMNLLNIQGVACGGSMLNIC